MPNAPHVTLREILPWIVKQGEAGSAELEKQFRMKKNDACMRLLRLHRYGYVSRERKADGTYRYTATAFGLKTAKKWSAH
jgi:DNA-binding IclR family transcriptional regulator